jgi:hypothetical protein
MPEIDLLGVRDMIREALGQPMPIGRRLDRLNRGLDAAPRLVGERGWLVVEGLLALAAGEFRRLGSEGGKLLAGVAEEATSA